MIAAERNILGLSVTVVAGQKHESKHLIPVLQGISLLDSYGEAVRPTVVSGDKAFSSDAIRQYLAEQDMIAVIPYKSNEHGASLPFDSERYKDRNVIERLFGRIKECRRVATRYEKYALTYLSMVLLSLIRLML
jgi:transposase